jgi:Zn-dependent M16 (insulinase) family peptidase
MTLVHGFELVREEVVAELKARARLYRHVRTGAELLSLPVADENKVFGITFRTPPSDHTGVAHILEHSVLCGSRRYPCKEPFVELLKGSLQTFLNAFTYPDKTCYPVASQNLQDFYNLIEVYLDAVFHPLLARWTFEQEGWHYELDQPEAPLIFKGVVFNEMKGVYSSPDSCLVEYAQRSLFPDTTYGVDSGGDPEHIPDLTWEQLRAFHARFYHPSNARIYFYGDDPEEDRLSKMAVWLDAFEQRVVDSEVKVQAPFAKPRQVERHYAADPESGASQNFVTVNWVVAPATDAERALGLQILSHILIGTTASPLRKALLDSGLGDDLAGVGFENHARQTFFSTGLRGVSAARLSEVEPLVLDTLRNLVRDGLDPRTVEASLNTIEFALRENNSGSYPRGLVVMLRALTTWLYDGDPLAPLKFESMLVRLKAQLAAGQRVFESLIEDYFLKNTHRSTLILKPDIQLAAEREAREKARLTESAAALSAEQRQQLFAATTELKRQQVAPDDASALAAIPTLSCQDLDRVNRILPITKLVREGARILHHEVPTNGIVYLDLGLNIRTLPPELVPYVPLLGRALLETGTQKEDYVSLAQRIGSRTGGIHPQTATSIIRGTEASTCWLFLRAKAMAPQFGELLAILHDVVSGPRLDLVARLRQIAQEEKAMLESALIPSGHTLVATRLRASFNEADWAGEQMRGVSYLLFLRKLVKDLEVDADAVIAALSRTLEILLNRRTMLFNVTLDPAGRDLTEPLLRSFISDLPDRVGRTPVWPKALGGEPEGLAIPAQVNYVGKAVNLFPESDLFDGTALVVARYLRSSYLWEHVRVQGGAYGGFCQLDLRSGVFNLVSYRDPNVQATLHIYDRIADYLNALDLSESEVTKAIIGAIGDMDQPLLPDAKGYVSALRYLANESDDFRQQMREQILSTRLTDFHNFGDLLQVLQESRHIVVLGSAEALEKAGGLTITRVM